MRTTLLACLFLIACGGGGGTSSDMMMGDDVQPMPDAPTIDPPARGFQIVTPDFDVGPQQEITVCYYFRTPNTEPMAIKKWVSAMTPGSHHLIMFTTAQDKMPPGTISANGCGFGGGTQNVPNWVYSAQTANASMQLPTDDGAGNPLAIDIGANQAGFVQMHYFNPSDNAIKVHVTINAEALEAGATYTKTAAYVTYNNSISIPQGATNDVEMQQCNVPQGAKFWLMSTHAHKQAIKTEILDGTTMVFSSTDWEHPGAETWMSTPFKTFASGKVTYRCTYNNPTNRVITSGDSAATDEMCMASGYYFPATKSLICFDGFGPF